MKFYTILIFTFFLNIYAFSQSKSEKLLNEGIQLFYDGNNDGAIKVLKSAIKADKTNADAHYFIGLIKNQSNMNDGLEDLNKAIELNPKLATAYNVRAGIKSFQGDELGAFNDYDMAVKNDSLNGGYYFNRASSKVTLKDFKGAIEDCEKCLKLEPTVISFIYLVAAEAKSELGKFDEALKDCEIYVEKGEELDSYFYKVRGEINFKKKDFESALQDFIKGAEPELDSGYGFFLIGKTLLQLNDLKQACHFFNEAKKSGFDQEKEEFSKCK